MESYDNNAYGMDYGTPDYSGMEDNNDHRPKGFPWIMYNIHTFIIFPAVLILNLILLIKIFGNQKLRSEPWRWLVAHTSVCFMLTILISYNSYASFVYLTPSLLTTPVCPAVQTLSMLSWHMGVVSVALLAAERFNALRMGRENEGGMGKKAVVLSLVLFWLLLIVLYVIGYAIVPLFTGHSNIAYHEINPGNEMCFMTLHGEHDIIVGLLFLWALVSVIVAIIGSAVYKNRKTTTDAMRQSIVVPTLAFCCITFFLMLVPDFLFIVMPLFIYMGPSFIMLHFTIWLLNCIAFPIIWLVTWSRTGDISWNRKDDAEHRRLLESN